MARQYIKRSEKLKRKDIEREKDHNWFLGQQWVGMALYTDGFAKDLQGLKNNLHYFQQLGINMIHNLNLNDPKIKSVFFNTQVILLQCLKINE